MPDTRIGTTEAARILGCSLTHTRKLLRAAGADIQQVAGTFGGVKLMILKSDVEAYAPKTKAVETKSDGTKIEFRDAYCRWHVPEFKDVKPPDELRVESKTAAVREGLTAALESGVLVTAAGRSYDQTKYKVIREVDGVFALVSTRGMR